LGLALSSPATVAGKSSGKGPVRVQVKISAQFANFPLPVGTQLVPKQKQKAAAGWVEYRVTLSTVSLAAFYRTNMPGHGWKLKSCRGNTWTWSHGRRTIIVIYVRITPFFSFIQVRELR